MNHYLTSLIHMLHLQDNLTARMAEQGVAVLGWRGTLGTVHFTVYALKACGQWVCVDPSKEVICGEELLLSADNPLKQLRDCAYAQSVQGWPKCPCNEFGSSGRSDCTVCRGLGRHPKGSCVQLYGGHPESQRRPFAPRT